MSDKRIDYDALMKDETVQALLTHLNISININQIIQNESILFLLEATKNNVIKLYDSKHEQWREWKRRARNYTTYEYLMTQNEEYNKFKDNNPFSLKDHATKRLQLYTDILKYTYGLSDQEIIKENFNILQPICEGELYKMINDLWDSWDMGPIINSITQILNITKVKLQQNLHEKEKIEKRIDKLLSGPTMGITEYIDKPEPQEGIISINNNNEIIIK